MKNSLKVAFVTSTDPNDKTSWSGIHYKMFTTLKDNFEVVEAIGPIDNLFFKSFGIINRITRFLFSKGYNHKNSIARSYFLSKIIQRRLRKDNYDVIFAPAASTEIAFLKTDLPICSTSDSSFGQLKGYYDTYSNLFNFSAKESNFIEQKALLKASYMTYPSQWAKEYIEKNYQKKASIDVIPFGANILDEQISYIEKSIDKSKPVHLLFLGVDWLRKGGDIVFETFLLLKEKYDVKLTVCGCIPPVSHPDIEVIPFLNKNNPVDFEQFNKMLEQTHLLFLPSRSECFGIVFCEASAYGIPSIASNTGGIEGAITNNVNGYCLDVSATPANYFSKISHLIENADDYIKISESSRKLYLEKLNWNNWGKEISNKIIATALQKK
ncbi:glycosyltransferase family 4 protein [Flavobacterium qiangtangense]|uniref:Glycosyltransferase family 4 protein n=1 Tax=Flavobacterium qiangtangense TaxID=1442595 RepID=A0ABW1PP31_9FLAO